MDPLSRLIASLSRGVLMRSLWRLLPAGGGKAWVVALVALVAYFASFAAQAAYPDGGRVPSCTNGNPFVHGGGAAVWRLVGTTAPWPLEAATASGQGWCEAYQWDGNGGSFPTNGAPNRTFTPNPGTDPEAGTCKGESAQGFDRFQVTIIKTWDGSCGTNPPPPPPPDPSSCVKGAVLAPANTVFESGALSTQVCIGGCLARAKSAAESSSGKFYVWGPITGTGESCTTGAPTTPGSPAPDPSKPGYCPVTVNGQAVAVPCDKAKTDTVSSSSGSASSPSGAASSNGTTITTTTCTGAGSCTTTTTTTTTKSDGTTETKTEEKPTEEKSFCEQNPTMPICQEGKFGGSCSSGFTCSGDAVQCSIARELHARNCEFFAPSDASSVGTAAASGGLRPGDHPGLSPVSQALTFDQSALIGAGACPADINVNMGGLAPLVLSFSALCGVAGWLGNLLVAMTALACLSIVFVRGS